MPRIGGSFTIETEYTYFDHPIIRSSQRVWILTGFSRLSAPIDLGPLSYCGGTMSCTVFCGSLFLVPDVVQQTLIGVPTGWALVTYRVPNDQSLLGLNFYQQVLEHEWDSGAQLLSRSVCTTSAAGHGVIGS